MIFKKLTIEHAGASWEFNFSRQTLIKSDNNSVGKSALLRLLFFSIGYDIPELRNFSFSDLKLTCTLLLDDGNEAVVTRRRHKLTLILNEKATSYELPNGEESLHSIIYGIEDPILLNQVLPISFIEQERGWTLLNRGSILGKKYHFNIELFIATLSGRDTTELRIRLDEVEKKVRSYRQMDNLRAYKASVMESSSNTKSDKSYDSLMREKEILLARKSDAERTIRLISSSLKKNENLLNFLCGLRLEIKTDSGTTIQLTRENIIGWDDNQNFIRAQKLQANSELAQIKQELLIVEREIHKRNLLFTLPDLMEEFNKSIAAIPVDQAIVQSAMNKLGTARKRIETEFMESIKYKNTICDSLEKQIHIYAKEFGVENHIKNTELFTTDIKSLSGAIHQKIVMAFRMSYWKALRDVLNIRVPIVIDSPRGRELDQKNLTEIMNALVRDFSEHQIIVASIFKCDELRERTEIEIKNRLLGEKNADEFTLQ